MQKLVGSFTTTIGKEQGKVIAQLYGLGEKAGSAFRIGLLGIVEPSDIVDQAMKELTTNITSDIDEASKAIKSDRDNIRQAKNDIASDVSSIRTNRKQKDSEGVKSALKSKRAHEEEEAAAKKALKADQDLLNILKDTSSFIIKDNSFNKNKADLKEQTALYDSYTKAVDEARQKLEDLKTERDNFVKSKFEQFSALPDLVTRDENDKPIDPETQVKNYTTALHNSEFAVGTFVDTLDKLKGMGLNEDTYRQLLDIGPAAQAFASALISMGPSAIASINSADAGLQAAAHVMADHAGAALYNVGISAGEALVKSLDDERSKIYGKMVQIAEEMVKAIKKKLHIRSPSRVFEEIGRQSTDGLAKGLIDSSAVVTDAVAVVADDAVAAMRNSLTGISDAIAEHIDPNPTITPVLDLTDIQNGAKSLNDMLNVIPISAAASFGQASSISTDQQAAQAAADAAQSVIKFEQNNYSPESLSSIEIYRQTKNQLAQARPVLAT
jgi:hypothetical protein